MKEGGEASNKGSTHGKNNSILNKSLGKDSLNDRSATLKHATGKS